VSQTPSEPASPRALARARARGDFPYAAELTFALVLLALVAAVHPARALLAGWQRLAQAAFAGRQAQVWTELPRMLQPLGLLLGLLAAAALVALIAQRAPTLRSAPDNTGRSDSAPARAGRGRALHSLMTGFKGLVLGVGLVALVYDSLAGWRATYTHSAPALLELSGQLLPALLMRAAWMCVLLGAVELGVQYVSRLQRLRMTRQQVQDEQRELAGDPRFLSERRARATPELPARLSPQLIAADLAQLGAASLLITGASCVVAVEYSPERGVPRVWSSATGTHALELLARAYSLQLPIVSDEPLAAALFRVPLRAAIPAAWHAHVARLLVEHAVPAAREAS
jgi:flagellar biosynthesis protein FlhB